jgi:hypothetical protein
MSWWYFVAGLIIGWVSGQLTRAMLARSRQPQGDDDG